MIGSEVDGKRKKKIREEGNKMQQTGKRGSRNEGRERGRNRGIAKRG